MAREVMEHLAVDKGIYVDATVGGGDHSAEILRNLRQGMLIAIDRDEEAIAFVRERLKGQSCRRAGVSSLLVHGNFADLDSIANTVPEIRQGVSGILFDLGLSRHQAVTPERGFSYQSDGPLDMRADRSTQKHTARDVVRHSSEAELARIIRDYGEERFHRRISRRIALVRSRLHTTGDLAEAVRSVVPFRFQAKAVARVFQAFRIAVNDELENLRCGLRQAIGLLAEGGRIVVLAYHSLEDRIVKQTFRDFANVGRIEILTRRPLRPSPAEVAVNPSARSARLRAATTLKSRLQAQAGAA
jgi:16S rRNA (cytosine1402-N4)-methyltransferase